MVANRNKNEPVEKAEQKTAEEIKASLGCSKQSE